MRYAAYTEAIANYLSSQYRTCPVFLPSFGGGTPSLRAVSRLRCHISRSSSGKDAGRPSVAAIVSCHAPPCPQAFRRLGSIACNLAWSVSSISPITQSTHSSINRSSGFPSYRGPIILTLRRGQWKPQPSPQPPFLKGLNFQSLYHAPGAGTTNRRPALRLRLVGLHVRCPFLAIRSPERQFRPPRRNARTTLSPPSD